MDLRAIPIGSRPPDHINAIIEVPVGGVPVKYELDKASGAMYVDRFLHTAMYYPANYGFIPHTLALDEDPLDVLVIGRVPVVPGAVIPSRPIGVLFMEDEAGQDEKILALPADSLHPYHANISTYRDLPEVERQQIEHFFKHYKDLEPGKWARMSHWGGPEEARKVIMDSIARAGNDPKVAAQSS